MLRPLLFIFLFTAQLSVLSHKVFAEYVFLNDGQIVKGEIIKDGAQEIVLSIKDKTSQTIQRKNILRILYTELKMGKIYVQKRSGESILAYIVNEDRLSYTFRKNLTKPQEFTLKREEVLFIAEKNPSGLKVIKEPDTNSVSLAWLAPYGIVKKYNLYIRKDKNATPTLIASANDKRVVLNKLESHTRYFVLVKAVDEENGESLPSNEIEITTANIPPFAPSDLEFIRDELSPDAQIHFTPAVDPDGKVVKYQFRILQNNKITTLSEAFTTDWQLKNWRKYEDLWLEVVAVDDMNSESQPRAIKLRGCKNTLRIAPAMMLPLGKLGEMGGVGLGGLLSMGRKQFLINSLSVELEAGFFSLPGKTSQDGETSIFNSIYLLPLWATFRYEVWNARPFFLSFSLSAGTIFGSLSYDYKETPLADYEKKQRSFLDPSAKAGIWAEYRFNHTYSLVLALEGGALKEEDFFPFLVTQLGLEYRY